MNTNNSVRNRLIDEKLIYTETNLQGKITFVTTGFVKISGYSKEELIGNSHSIVRHKDMPKDFFANMWKTLKSGKRFEGEVKNLTKDGHFYWVDTIIEPLYDKDNQVVGYGSFRREITQEVLEREKRKLLFNSHRSIVFITNGLELKEINNTFFEEYGYKNLEDFNNKHKCICELFIEKEDERFLKPSVNDLNWLVYVEENPNEFHEICMINKDKEEKIYTVDVTRNLELDTFGKVSMVKLTEITKLKEQLNMFKGQSRFAAMGEMVAMIAHQWRQPLTALNGIVEHLDSRWKRNKLDSEFFERKTNQQKELIHYLNQTITDFLTFFKEDNKNEEKNLLVKDLLAMSYKLTESLLRTNSIKYEVNLNNNDNLKIKIASTKFDEVVINIMKNAIDALIENNSKNPFIKIEIIKGSYYLNIYISDNAGGIPEDILPYIFEPYYSTKGKNGNGLGLYMSKLLMEKHIKGKIDVKNTDNGTKFTLRIPL